MGWCLTLMGRGGRVRGWRPALLLVSSLSLSLSLSQPLLLLIQTQPWDQTEIPQLGRPPTQGDGASFPCPILWNQALASSPPARMLPLLCPTTSLLQTPSFPPPELNPPKAFPPPSFLLCSHFSAPQKYYFIQQVHWM